MTDTEIFHLRVTIVLLTPIAAFLLPVVCNYRRPGPDDVGAHISWSAPTASYLWGFVWIVSRMDAREGLFMPATLGTLIIAFGAIGGGAAGGLLGSALYRFLRPAGGHRPWSARAIAELALAFLPGIFLAALSEPGWLAGFEGSHWAPASDW